MIADFHYPSPGPIVLFGSGETSPSGQKIFNAICSRLASSYQQNNSIKVAILETPAGFELNSAQVAGKVGDFISQRLQNYYPQVELVPARQRGTLFSPDNADILSPLLGSDLIFMGPGSPSYAVRQLNHSLAWQYLVARHRMGVGLALASAATIAIGACALPVYEIYKVGEELHWKPGLDLLSSFGLSIVFVPHWNNSDGGYDLDTSRCFIGRERFETMQAMLPGGQTVVGIDEKTGLLIEFDTHQCTVLGSGSVTLQRSGQGQQFAHGVSFNIEELGDFQLPSPEAGISPGVWKTVLRLARKGDYVNEPPGNVRSIVALREEARRRKAWDEADILRQQITALGWQVKDTPEGPVLEEII